MPLLKYLPHEICKPKQPKSLPHEICKPTPAIRVYPAAPHEFFIPKPTVKPTTPPKPVTLIRARLWGLPPDRKQKKKKKFSRFTILLHQIRSKDKRKLKTHHQSRRSHQQNAAVAQPAADTPSPSLPPCRFTGSEIWLTSSDLHLRVPLTAIADEPSHLFAVDPKDSSCFALPLHLFFFFSFPFVSLSFGVYFLNLADNTLSFIF